MSEHKGFGFHFSLNSIPPEVLIAATKAAETKTVEKKLPNHGSQLKKDEKRKAKRQLFVESEC